MVGLTAVTTWAAFGAGAVSAVCAGVPALVFVGRRVWRAIIETIAAEVADINRKVTPNGGYSGDIGDRVARIERAVGTLVEGQKAVGSPCGADSGRQAGIT